MTKLVHEGGGKPTRQSPCFAGPASPKEPNRPSIVGSPSTLTIAKHIKKVRRLALWAVFLEDCLVNVFLAVLVHMPQLMRAFLITNMAEVCRV